MRVSCEDEGRSKDREGSGRWGGGGGGHEGADLGGDLDRAGAREGGEDEAVEGGAAGEGDVGLA